jgi:hypothetical protein
LIGLNARTAFTREAATAGANAHTTFGGENQSKPRHDETGKNSACYNWQMAFSLATFLE